jgi:TBC1 domain family member 15
VRIQQSTIEPQLYLIDPSTDDILNLTPSPSTTPSQAEASMDPLTQRLKEARWSLLEKFARVTAFGRRTASDILEQPIVKEQIIPRLPPQMRDIVKSKVVQSYAGEYDSAREYLARWAAGVAEEAERQKGKRGEEVGSIWGTNRHAGWEESSELGGFEVLSISPPVRVERKGPVTEKMWNKYFDHTGRLAISTSEVKEAIFHGVFSSNSVDNRESITMLVLKFGNSYWDYILGTHPPTNEKQ